MNTIILFTSLIVGVLAIVVSIFNYQKYKASDPEAASVLARKIALLTLIITVLNGTQPLLDFFKPQPSSPVTKEELAEELNNLLVKLNKAKNPPLEEAQREFEKELQADFTKKKKRALQLYDQGNRAYERDQYPKAIAYFTSALEITQTPALYFALGNSYFMNDDSQSAQANLQTALHLYQENNNRQGEGESLMWLGYNHGVLATLADYDIHNQLKKAIEVWKKAAEIFGETGDKEHEWRVSDALGLTCLSLGRVEANEYLSRARHLVHESDNSMAKLDFFASLTCTYVVFDQWDNATEYFNQVLDILRETDDQEKELWVLNLIEQWLFNSNFANNDKFESQEDKTAILKQGLAFSRESGNWEREKRYSKHLIQSYRFLNQHDKIIEISHQELISSREARDKNSEVENLLHLVDAYESIGQHDKANQYLEDYHLISGKKNASPKVLFLQ